MLNIKVVTWSLAIFTSFTFVFCVVYGAYAGLVYVPVYNFLHKTWVSQ